MAQNREELTEEHQRIEELLHNVKDENSLPIPAVILADRLQEIEDILLCQPLVDPLLQPLDELDYL